AQGGNTKDREKTPPRCHLHPAKKPNAKCRFCQKAQGTKDGKAAEADSKNQKEESGGSASSKSKKVEKQVEQEEEEDYSRRTFKCAPMLKDQIFGSSYFKSLLQMSTIEELMEEISNYADTLDVYNAGTHVSPSCFICQVYRLFTLPSAESLDEMQVVLDHPTSAKVRCAGFLYMRFVVPPAKIFERLEEYLFDDTPLKYQDGGKTTNTTIGEYVEMLLNRDKYYNTTVPRLPVKVRHLMEKELAPIKIFRKRMQAHLTNSLKKISGQAVEVWNDGQWIRGIAREYVGKVVKTRKVRVELEEGDEEIVVHMGKVVLRDTEEKEKDKEKEKEKEDESEDERSVSDSEGGRKRRRKRSRSRRRARSASPATDWSRFKGEDDDDKNMLQALREKTREEAVCSTTASSKSRRDESGGGGRVPGHEGKESRGSRNREE
ncbi:unnamed protein product, partial [Polarella glacialis]